MQQHQGLVWVEHREVGFALSQLTGAPYYGPLGQAPDGRSILDARGSAIVSQKAVSEGFNLQYTYNRNLILNMTPNGKRYQQCMGRTHRVGQRAHVVHFEQLCTVHEQIAGFEKALREAHFEKPTSGEHKLVLADISRRTDHGYI